jgi:hypothetical protein
MVLSLFRRIEGEEVYEVPKPANYPGHWNKYCVMSKDWRKMQQHEYLDKSDTGYHDFVSVHIKVLLMYQIQINVAQKLILRENLFL